MSEGRLNSILRSELAKLIDFGAVTIQENKAILNLQKLDEMLKDATHIQSLSKQAGINYEN